MRRSQRAAIGASLVAAAAAAWLIANEANASHMQILRRPLEVLAAAAHGLMAPEHRVATIDAPTCAVTDLLLFKLIACTSLCLCAAALGVAWWSHRCGDEPRLWAGTAVLATAVAILMGRVLLWSSTMASF